MALSPEGPRSRRERPAKPALSREGIVSLAVDLVRTEGLKRVTMRRLAQELDTGAASLYVYVRNTAELHAAVLDELLGSVDLSPVTSEGDWRDRLAEVVSSYTWLLFRHPGLAQSALVARPSGDNYLSLVEAMLALLDEGGVPSGQASWGVDVLMLHSTASAAEHSSDDKDETEDASAWEALTGKVLNASAETHPHVAAIGADLLAGPPTARRSWILRALINGIATTPRTELDPH
ncbi:TetR/AcrR family transcriptional regulator C-terminal domain-containing protein [Umezawaea sp. Da 62-37]|uniref:TetR/AcrR family transcriptional regulator n=1 Tax=Umezawaea sp. Da 62-37 TaxID=3075927 RepID=UPI0028F73FDB|nr:TetR/AcrR family transcriptional regulator C-terminal domain-containing protein [Umezawaea sp. Da 62-37]WNV86405.1 TetR/AcrR family transcriptional regulator C-terminal domain-containing protein [Umezawaea sp. Da 62-37]